MRHHIVTLVLAAAGVSVAGCGGASPTPTSARPSSCKVAMDDARAAISKLTWVKLSASNDSTGSRPTMVFEGKPPSGLARLTTEMYGHAERVFVDGETYLKPSLEFLTSSASGSAQSKHSAYADRWLHDPRSTEDFSGTFKEFLNRPFDAASPRSKALFGASCTVTSATLDGKDVWKLTAQDDSGTATAYVAADGTHRLLRHTWDAAASADETSIYTEFDQPRKITRPPNVTEVNLRDLTG